MIELYLDVIDAIHTNEHTKHAKCGLHVNFWVFLLMSSSFTMKKDYFKQKLLLWSQVPFKIFSKDYLVLCVEIYAQNKSMLFFDNNLVMLFLKSKLFWLHCKFLSVFMKYFIHYFLPDCCKLTTDFTFINILRNLYFFLLLKMLYFLA